MSGDERLAVVYKRVHNEVSLIDKVHCSWPKKHEVGLNTKALVFRWVASEAMEPKKDKMAMENRIVSGSWQ